VTNASDERGVDAAFAALVQRNAQAVIITGDPLFFQISVRLAALAARHGLPATFSRRSFAEAGGLVTYGANALDSTRQAGIYAGRLLRGEKPGDLPVVQPSKLDFVINLKTAKSLGITVPESLLATADEVIE
jgi:putative ABC transport system substrate-binding protein